VLRLCRSLLSLAFITLGAAGYVLTDKGFRVDAYMWVGVWFVVFAIDVVYIKYIVDTVPMTSWGRVYYQVRNNASPTYPPFQVFAVESNLDGTRP
jgi:hypothetical protein